MPSVFPVLCYSQCIADGCLKYGIRTGCTFLNKEMFAPLQSGPATILSELADIRKHLSTTKQTVSSLNTKWIEVNQVLVEMREKTSEIEPLQTFKT